MMTVTSTGFLHQAYVGFDKKKAAPNFNWSFSSSKNSHFMQNLSCENEFSFTTVETEPSDLSQWLLGLLLGTGKTNWPIAE